MQVTGIISRPTTSITRILINRASYIANRRNHHRNLCLKYPVFDFILLMFLTFVIYSPHPKKKVFNIQRFNLGKSGSNTKSINKPHMTTIQTTSNCSLESKSLWLEFGINYTKRIRNSAKDQFHFSHPSLVRT